MGQVAEQVEEAFDLYPSTEAEHAEMVSWCNDAYKAAETARQPHYDKWQKFHKLYRSFIEERKGDWRSRVFVPYVFSTVEAIMPKMVASLPKMAADPIGPEDVVPAKQLTRMLQYCADATDLDIELVKIYKQATKYGTGIGKTNYEIVTSRHRSSVSSQDQPGIPMIGPDGRQMTGLDNEPMNMAPEEETSGYTEFTIYEGPRARWVDIFNFLVAPEAPDLEQARYTIERMYREMSYIRRLVKQGVYRFPPHMNLEQITAVDDEPSGQRNTAIGLANNTDPTRRPVELREIWTDDGRCITIANAKAILRVIENPFDHGMKPYFRVVDYLNEGEFWGSGEIEALEGLQDLQNAIVNQRIDNVRMTMDQMKAVSFEALEDLRDLRPRPGGVVRVNGGQDPREVVYPLDSGDVTSSAFTEAEQIERLIERVSGVSAYQLGMDSPSMSDTATGVNTITEQGNTKFALKVKMAEMLGIRTMARQWGSLIQQYMEDPRVIRVLGPDGEWAFEPVTPESLLGAVDYSVEIGSSAATDSVMKEQSMTLLQVMAGLVPQAVPQLAQDVFEAFGRKNIQAYMGQQATLAGLAQSQMQQQMSAGAPAQQAALGQGNAQGPLPAPAGPPQDMPQQQIDPQMIAQLAQALGVPMPRNEQELLQLLQMAQQQSSQTPAPVSPQASFQYQMRPSV